MTTGKPAKVISGYKKGEKLQGVEMTFKMDVKTNKGLILDRKAVEVNSTGVAIELQFKDVSYSLSEQGAFEYIQKNYDCQPPCKDHLP